MFEPTGRKRRFPDGFRLFVLVVLSICASFPAGAQDDALNVQQTAEYDIGFHCPVTSILDPVGTTLWVLMNNCYDKKYSLHSFRPDDGALINAETDFFAPALESLDDQWIDPNTHPMAFTPDGALDILYSDIDAYDTHSLRLPFESEAAANDSLILTLDTLSEIIPGYAGFPELTVYNADHTLAAAIDMASLHVIDLRTGSDILQIEVEPETYNAYPSFSADRQRLYIATFNNIDDVDDYSAILRVYSLPGGDLLESYEVPSAFVSISPNGQYAAAWLGDAQGESETLYVVELASGRSSAPIAVFEPPRRILECLNREGDLSDLNYMTSGHLPIRDITWLSDSTRFFTVNSYMGEASAGGSICIWNYSRLRHYSISGE